MNLSFSTTVETEEDILEVDVEFNYIQGDPGIYSYSNGDPGYPPTGPEIEIISITCDNLEMIETVSENNMKILIDEAFEFVANYDKNNY